MKANLPIKTDINLCMQERSGGRLGILMIGLALILLLSGAVAKFGVIDLYERLSAAQAGYHRAYSQSRELSALLQEYKQVEAEYRTQSMCRPADTHVDRMQLLAMVERELLSVGQVQSLTVEDAQLTVTVKLADLEACAAVKTALERYAIVDSVRLDHAQTEENTRLVRVTMTVFLQPGEEDR